MGDTGTGLMMVGGFGVVGGACMTFLGIFQAGAMGATCSLLSVFGLIVSMIGLGFFIMGKSLNKNE